MARSARKALDFVSCPQFPGCETRMNYFIIEAVRVIRGGPVAEFDSVFSNGAEARKLREVLSIQRYRIRSIFIGATASIQALDPWYPIFWPFCRLEQNIWIDSYALIQVSNHLRPTFCAVRNLRSCSPSFSCEIHAFPGLPNSATRFVS
jgi:hypothetical protein